MPGCAVAQPAVRPESPRCQRGQAADSDAERRHHHLRIAMTVISLLLLAAAGANALLAGASLDQSIKQLLARHRMGAVTFSRSSQAADPATGSPGGSPARTGRCRSLVPGTKSCSGRSAGRRAGRWRHQTAPNPERSEGFRLDLTGAGIKDG